MCLEVITPTGADGFLRPAQTYAPTTEHLKNNAPDVQDDGAQSEDVRQGPAENASPGPCLQSALGRRAHLYPNSEIPLGARRPIANVECSQA